MPCNPVRYKHYLLTTATVFTQTLVKKATGALEAGCHGSATHRLREADCRKLITLRHAMLDVIEQATVEPATEPHLKLVK